MTRVELVPESLDRVKSDAIVVGWHTGAKAPAGPGARVDAALGGALTQFRRLGDFAGKSKDAAVLPTAGKIAAPRVLLLGLGPRARFGLDAVRQAAARAALIVRDRGLASLALPLLEPGTGRAQAADVARAMTEGALLGLFEFKEYKAEKPPTDEEETPKKRLASIAFADADKANAAPIRQGIEEGRILAEATNLARRLILLPSLAKSPPALAREAQQEAQRWGVEVRVWDKKRIAAHKMGGILGVSSGSVHEPRLVELVWPGQGKKAILLVGKGITFDSGGINIKASEGMERMKYDMAGSATVLAATIAAARLKLPHRVVALMPLAENMPSGSAIRPGDILTAFDGTTMEVGNTDAEGRLILADALAYGVKAHRPQAVVDVATLTGAIRTALGNITTGILGNDDRLVAALIDAGHRTGDAVWQLPLNADYEKMVESDIADLRNTGPGTAGAITAAAFLKRFVGKARWAHLDIAGTCWTEKGPGDLKKDYLPKGPTGVGVRLLVEFIRGFR